MIPIDIQTLMISAPSKPSVVILRPIRDTPTDQLPRIVPIWIGTNEATQLGVALEQTRLARPTTHDLFLDALTNLDTCIDHVLINDVKGSTFFAQLFLRHHGQVITLDARPSDAMSLAIRQQAPLYIEDDVFEQASFPRASKHTATGEFERELTEFHRFLDKLTPEDFEEK